MDLTWIKGGENCEKLEDRSFPHRVKRKENQGESIMK